MSYSHGIFVEKESARRALRDQMRDAFFAEIGLPRLTDPLRLDADPAERHAKMLDLIALARGTHAGDMSGLDQAEDSLRALAFALPSAGFAIRTPLSMAQVMPEGLQRHHFDMAWASWFDE